MTDRQAKRLRATAEEITLRWTSSAGATVFLTEEILELVKGAMQAGWDARQTALDEDDETGLLSTEEVEHGR